MNKDLNEFKIFIKIGSKFLVENIGNNKYDILGGLEYENDTLKYSIVKIMLSQYNIKVSKDLFIYLGTDVHDISYYCTIIDDYPKDMSYGLFSFGEFLNLDISKITRDFIYKNCDKISTVIRLSRNEFIEMKVNFLSSLYNKKRYELIENSNDKKYEKNKKTLIIKSICLLNNLNNLENVGPRVKSIIRKNIGIITNFEEIIR